MQLSPTTLTGKEILQNPEWVKKIESPLYVDDLVAGADNVCTRCFHILFWFKVIDVLCWDEFAQVEFKFCWAIHFHQRVNSQSPEKNEDPVRVKEEDESYTKASSGYSPNIEEDILVKFLGMLWNSSQDYLAFNFSELME